MPTQLPYRDCVGIVLLNTDGLILAGERLGLPGSWQMPQGGIDKGETPRDAALRELEEETGTAKARIIKQTTEWLTYDLPPELLGKAWKGRYRGQRQLWFAMAFDGSDDEIDIHGVDHPEFASWKWMSAADILKAIVPFKRDVYSEVFEAFADLTA